VLAGPVDLESQLGPDMSLITGLALLGTASPIFLMLRSEDQRLVAVGRAAVLYLILFPGMIAGFAMTFRFWLLA